MQMQAPVQVRLIAPRYVTYNGTATMHCNHSVPDEFLHKVEFMKDDKRILQYIKDRKPPFHRGEVEGASMEVSCTQLTQPSPPLYSPLHSLLLPPLLSLSFNYAVFKQLRSHISSSSNFNDDLQTESFFFFTFFKVL